MIYFCALRLKAMASMTIASSPNYLLVKVHRHDDHVSTYHVYCIVIFVFIYVIHYIIICYIVRSFLPSILDSTGFSSVIVTFVTWMDIGVLFA